MKERQFGHELTKPSVNVSGPILIRREMHWGRLDEVTRVAWIDQE